VQLPSKLPDIVDDYRDYTPPKWVRPAVVRLLEAMEPGQLAALNAVVLRNSGRLGKGKTSRVRGRKYRQRECLGFYHPAGRDGGAWIELVVDNIVRNRTPRLNFARDLIIGPTLFHEIGHHLHETIGSAKRGGEDSADDWSARLMSSHIDTRYKPFVLLVSLFGFILKPFLPRLVRSMKSRTRSSGVRTIRE